MSMSDTLCMNFDDCICDQLCFMAMLDALEVICGRCARLASLAAVPLVS